MALTEVLLKSNLGLREITPEESAQLKTTLLEMYKDIFEVCIKHNLQIFMGGGTCLGTVRHKGFIPWDDDLDLNMFREDYNKLPECMLKEFPEKYEIVGPGYTKQTPYNFIKIEKKGTILKTVWDDKTEKRGIGIDIFPIESIPKNKIHNAIHGFILNSIFYIAICTRLQQKPTIAHEYLLTTSEGKNLLKVRKFIGFLFSWKKYYSWNLLGDKIARKTYKSDFVSIPTGRAHYFGEIQKKDVFLPLLKATFEGLECFIPANYDSYLKALYGNYIQIPPIEKREKHFILEIKF